MAVYDEVNTPGRLTDAAGRLTQYAGAAVSLSLMVGVAVWGTKTILRDVSGVPVVRAMQGDMRVAPENPGGEVADHRGLAVNAVAAVGEAAAPEDTLTLAPRTFDLAAEDLDTEPLAATVPDDTIVPARADASEVQPVSSGPMSADDILALADQISAGVAPMAALEDMESGQPVLTVDGEAVTPEEVEAVAAADDAVSETTEIVNMDAADPIAAALAEAMGDDTLVPAPVAALRAVLRPTARPMQPSATVATAEELTPAAVTVASVDEAVVATVATAGAPVLPAQAVLTDDLPVGTKLVQLGAFPTPQDAAAEWMKLTGRFGDVMTGKQQVIQEASSGGATFYRLRASGFDALDDARQFCTTLDAGRAACIPVVVR